MKINSLRILKYNASINPRNFISFLKYCKNIEHLIVNSYYYDNSGLAQLILAQKSLKCIELKAIYSFNYLIEKFNLLSEALIKQTNEKVSKLKSIYFDEFIFTNKKCMQILSKSTLKVLKLKIISFTSIIGFEMISHLHFTKLEAIYVYSYISYDISLLKNFIRNTMGNLK